jgi:hypothetical protein
LTKQHSKIKLKMGESPLWVWGKREENPALKLVRVKEKFYCYL